MHRLVAGPLIVTIFVACVVGCESSSKKSPTKESSVASNADTSENGGTKTGEQPISDPTEYPVDATALLAATLSDAELEDGWVSLFDGQSLYGWFIVGKANWRVADGSIQVDRGEKSFLCTNFKLADCEILVDFKAEAKTNSGVFLRTQPSPQDVTEDCIELNIAPPENPFPTGSLVQRKKLESAELGNFDTSKWHTYAIRMQGDKVSVVLDGRKLYEYTDDSKLGRGHISLQHNEGFVAFKNIRLRPLDAKPLKMDANWEDDWVKSQKEGATFNVEPTDAGLKLTGGLGQVQSKADFGDFILQASYKIAKPEVNSGIFFRCVRDSMLDGYECQVNHAIKDNDPLQPADSGAGAIFRRAPARIVIGDGSKLTYLTLLATGPQITSWVNGVQVVDFVDTRPDDDNPRKGRRTAPGPISLQGHDPTTDATFRSIKISEVP